MGGDKDDRAAVVADLHRRLEDGLARSRRSKAQLAGLVGLSRTTVHEAFRSGAVPSAETTAALARGLGLDEAEMLGLRRRACGLPRRPSAVGVRADGVGLPIDAWNPHDLEVHPAAAMPGAGVSGRDGWVLPGYVERGHDGVLAKAVCGAAAGRSAMVVLVGSSSTGKTRACWEAVQPLAGRGWRLWHPFDPTRADAALADLARVGPQTVVWLNEAQHYLGDPRVGEQVAAAVHTLLTDPGRGPVLVLGTLWPEYAHQYAQLPAPRQPDPHSRARELLAGRTLAVPDAFDDDAVRAAHSLAEAGDRHLADTLARARGSGRIAQDLAGAPELLRRYGEATAPARALLDVAVDARRLGMGLHLPWAFLVDAAAGYLGDDDWDALDEDWPEAAFAELAIPVHGKHAPLRRIGRPRRHPDGTAASSPAAGPTFRLADYLEQHGRNERRWVCPLASFWEAAAHTATPEELAALAQAARDRGRYRHAALLYRQAADAGDTKALRGLAEMREEAEDHDGAEHLARQAADAGDTSALWNLAEMREEAGDRDGAEHLYRQAADAGNTSTLWSLARMREEAGDHDGAEHLYRQAADAGNTIALWSLARMREEAGDHDGAEHLYRQAADAGHASALRDLARMWEKAGDHDGAEHLYRQAADAGDTWALLDLARMREEAGDRDGAEHLYRQAADAGNIWTLPDLAQMREEAGDRDGAERLARHAADAGDTIALLDLARMREEAGDRDGAERLARHAADVGATWALWSLARMREKAGDRDGAEHLYQQAADAGHAGGLWGLARMREKAGDRDGAEQLYRQAADAASPLALRDLARVSATDQCPESQILRFGWEPDGRNSSPW